MSNNSGTDIANIEHLVTTTKAKSFLGKEFLTWFWYSSEQNDKLFKIKGRDKDTYNVQIWIDDRIVLESQNSKAHMQTLKGGDPSQSFEATASLQAGKSVKELRAGFHVEDIGDFMCSLSGTDLTPRSIRLPDPSEDYAELESFSSLSFRLKSTQILVDVIDGLFAEFLTERVAPTWQSEGLSNIKSWIQDRYHQANTALH